MAQPPVGMTDPHQILIFQELITMGFDPLRSEWAAQLCNGDLRAAADLLCSDSYRPPKKNRNLYFKKTKMDNVYTSCRPNYLMKIFMAGYIREISQKVLLNQIIPQDINMEVVKHLTFLFIKIIEPKQQQTTETETETEHNENKESESREEIKKDEESTEKENSLGLVKEVDSSTKIIKIDSKMTFMSIALEIENEEKYEYSQEEDKPYPRFVRIWLRLSAIKQMYPLTIKRKKNEININIDDINKGIKRDNDNDKRWIELPWDWMKLSLNDIDKKIKDKKHNLLEIKIEKFDIKNMIWPFENEINNDIDNDESKVIENTNGISRLFCKFVSKFGEKKKDKVDEFEEWVNKLKIGDIIDVCDFKGAWYQGFIRCIEFNEKLNDKIFSIHYIGWSSKWDAKLSATSDSKRIAKRNSKTRN